MKQPGFFDFANRYEDISKFGDPLERLSKLINFEAFRKELEMALVLSQGNEKYGSLVKI